MKSCFYRYSPRPQVLLREDEESRGGLCFSLSFSSSPPAAGYKYLDSSWQDQLDLEHCSKALVGGHRVAAESLKCLGVLQLRIVGVWLCRSGVWQSCCVLVCFVVDLVRMYPGFFVQLKFIVAPQEKQTDILERPLAPVPVCSISVVLTAVCVVISDYSHHHLIPVLRSMTTGIFKQASSPAKHHSGWTLSDPYWKPLIWIVSRSTDQTNQPPNEERKSELRLTTVEHKSHVAPHTNGNYHQRAPLVVKKSDSFCCQSFFETFHLVCQAGAAWAGVQFQTELFNCLLLLTCLLNRLTIRIADNVVPLKPFISLCLAEKALIYFLHLSRILLRRSIPHQQGVTSCCQRKKKKIFWF